MKEGYHSKDQGVVIEIVEHMKSYYLMREHKQLLQINLRCTQVM
jgi:hypothetical protein